ncbi:MAG: arsenite methyltransferase [Candidatus Lokiarchaeota archaeon]|nr:arsenite methyltransferase [Candidatus Lokiarchaeota archaeon]
MVEENWLEDAKIRQIVRERYAKVAEGRQEKASCCGPAAPTESPTMNCCGPSAITETPSLNSCSNNTCSPIELPADKVGDFLEKYSSELGYSEEELKSVPDGANLALGCGNPTAHASIKEGETVLDLGAGGGLDCFIAANKVGKTGKVIGVDMTPQMIDRARENAKKGNYENIEFRLGEIENLPVANDAVDLIISNCVINLSPNKERVFNEAFRVLKPGGRMMLSDNVLLKELPDIIKENKDAYVGCISGAIMKDRYLELIEEAGFQDVEIMEESTFSTIDFLLDDPIVKTALEEQGRNLEELKNLEEYITNSSIKVKAVKPN